MEVFKKEKFIETMGDKVYKLISSNDEFNWVDRLDGKEVTNGCIKFMR